MKRLRIGIILFIISWLPISQVCLAIAHNNGQLTSSQDSDTFRAIVWTIQVIIGLIGVWLAGKVAIDEAKKEGWKRAPALLWKIFWHGKETVETDTPSNSSS